MMFLQWSGDHPALFIAFCFSAVGLVDTVFSGIAQVVRAFRKD